MAVIYSILAKHARMEAVRNALDGGAIEIGTEGMAAVLAIVPLGTPSGSVLDDTLTVAMPEFGAFALQSGIPRAARLRNVKMQDVLTGLVVGPGGEVELTGLRNGKIEKGQAVVISSLTLKHA